MQKSAEKLGGNTFSWFTLLHIVLLAVKSGNRLVAERLLVTIKDQYSDEYSPESALMLDALVESTEDCPDFDMSVFVEDNPYPELPSSFLYVARGSGHQKEEKIRLYMQELNHSRSYVTRNLAELDLM